MSFNELSALLKKKGFRETFHILASSKDFQCDRKTFYKELNQFSYYNSFFRIKEDLINRGLLDIERNDGKKVVKLTKKGIEVYNKLLELNDIIHNSQ